MSAAEAARRLVEFGANAVEKVRQERLAFRFLKGLTHFFAIILWLAAGMAFFAEAADAMRRHSRAYEFTNIVNRSLTANFVPAGPGLSWSVPQPGALTLTWTTNAVGFVLQRTSELGSTNWVNDLNPVTVAGTNNQVTITPLTGTAYFRLYRP